MKRRNREINIFNMSLLDILCGALGAFCFMMLSLLPYYRPPGKDINISKEQKDLLDEVQKIKDLAERLKNTSRAEDLTELVKQLREQITALENRIKKLQGEVNALYAENDELKGRVSKLEVENGMLRTRNEQLEKDNQQLKARNQQLEQEKQQLLAEKQQLLSDKQQLQTWLAQRTPWTVSVTPDDARVSLDCSLHEKKLTVITNGKEGSYPEFDPSLPMQPTVYGSDMRLTFGSTATRLFGSRAPGSEGNFYIKVISRPLHPGQNLPVLVKTEVAGANLEPVSIRSLPVPSDRNWIFAGKLRIESPTRIIFTEATPAERDAEWQRLEKTAEPPQTAPTPAPQMLTDAVMGPGFEQRKRDYENRVGPNAPPPLREAMLQLWLAESQSPQERKYVGDLIARRSPPDDRRRTPPGPGSSGSDDPRAAADAAGRRGQYVPAINSAASRDEKIALLRKWMNEATTDSERDFVRQMLQRTNAGPAPKPTVPPEMSREQAIEESRRRGENPTLPPPPPSPGPQPQPK